MKLARIERELNPFPRITTPSSFIDVVEGSRLPARVVDAPAPTTPYRTTRAALAEDMAVTAPDTPAPAGLASTAMQDLAQAQARNATHIGTVSRGPVGTLSSKPFNKLTEMSWNKGGLPDLTSTNLQQADIPVFEIGGRRVAFGNTKMRRFDPEFNSADIEFVPINPYEITKLSPTSKEGQEMAMQFTDALNGNFIESQAQGRGFNVNDQLQVVALQYGASQGDKIAAAELERLARVGREMVYLKRLDEAQGVQQFVAQYLNGFTWDDIRDMQVEIGRGSNGERLVRGLGIDDLFVVHQTRFKPQVDANGNIVLRPASEFSLMDPETGKPLLDPVTGDLFPKPNRNTIHFALNHLVGSNMMRNTPDVSTYAIIAPLRDILDANPGSLDNLFAVDTYFTPKPGEGLVIPMRTAKVVELPGVNKSASADVAEGALARLATQNEQIVSQTMNEVGRSHNQYPEYQARLFPDYGQHSLEPIDIRMRDLATGDIPQQYKEYGPRVESSLHAASQLKGFELAAFMGDQYSNSFWAQPTDSLSPNARLRLFNTNRYGSGKLQDASYDESWS